MCGNKEDRNERKNESKRDGGVVTLCIGLCFIPNISGAHCGKLEGPVVAAARVAPEKDDVTPILKWIQTKDEREVKDLFDKTLVVRKQSKEAKELADMYFFEILAKRNMIN